jgi:DNA anti-recombination protein RmuC
MFSKIKAFFVTVEHDVEAIIANFTNTVTKLEAAAKAKATEFDTLTAKAEQLKVEAGAALAASDKAAAVADKIKALVA